MALFAISVLLQREDDDGTVTTSHTLHWREAQNADDAIVSATEEAKLLKPTLNVVDVLCGDIYSSGPKRVSYSDSKTNQY